MTLRSRREPDISPRHHIPPRTYSLGQIRQFPFTWCTKFPAFTDVGRLGSGLRDSASFQEIPRLVSRLGSGPRVVGRLGSGLRDSASFQEIPRLVSRLGSGPRVVGRLGSGVRVSASFQIFALTAGDVLSGGDCLGDYLEEIVYVRGISVHPRTDMV